jgi:hypothetical protein
MHERWKVIADYPKYEVSDLGRVRSKDRVIVDKNGRVMCFKGQIRKQHADKQFHRLRVTLRSPAGSSDSKLIHRLVLQAFVGPQPPGMEGCHKDGNAHNNKLSNLRWDDRESNVSDVYRHGIRRRDPKAMLPRLQARPFVSAYLSGLSGLV